MKEKKPKKSNHSPLKTKRLYSYIREYTPKVIFLGCAILLVLLLSFLLTPNLHRPRYTYDYSLDEIADRDIKATREFSVEDVETTEKRRQQAIASTSSVYDFDSLYAKKLRKTIEDIFNEQRQIIARNQKMYQLTPTAMPEKEKTKKSEKLTVTIDDVKIEVPTDLDNQSQDTDADNSATIELYPILTPGQRYQNLIQRYQIDMSQQTFEVFNSVGFNETLEARILRIIDNVFNKYVVSDLNSLEEAKDKGLQLRDLGTGMETLIKDISRIMDLSQCKELIKSSIIEYYPADQVMQQALERFLGKLIKPTLTIDKLETQRRKQEAVEAVDLAYFKVKKGEMIVREGERINKVQLMKLQALKELRSTHGIFTNWLGMLLQIIVLLAVTYIFLSRFDRMIRDDKKNFLLLVVLLVLNILLSRGFIALFDVLGNSIASRPFNYVKGYYYAVPFALGSLMATLLLFRKTAFSFVILSSIFIGMIPGLSFEYAIYSFLGGLVAILSSEDIKRRAVIWYSGLAISVVNVAAVLALNMKNGIFFSSEALLALFCAFIGGLLVSVLASAFLPVLEALFNVTTVIRLLEIGTTRHPLLKELLTKAPGTFQHSQIVANLAESAAEDIKVNAVLVRVAALFHDIGKINKPEYFSENQSGYNKHDQLKPNMSALIIKSHVKEGIEMAKRYKLGKPIIDILQQHHGTGLIYYFYDKALKVADQGCEVSQADFRYPGPRPRTKEAAIVLLADCVEAAVRALPNPTSSNIKQRVREISLDKFRDGQFDHCNLTFHELTIIINSFVKILISMYHTRIEYPHKQSKEQQRKEDSRNSSKTLEIPSLKDVL